MITGYSDVRQNKDINIQALVFNIYYIYRIKHLKLCQEGNMFHLKIYYYH